MKKIGKVIIVVVILLLIGGGLVIYFNKDEDNFIGEIFNEIEEDEADNDNRNGFYLYTDKLDKTYKLSNSCTLNTNKYIIAVVNNDWYLYRSSCLGVYQLKSGKTEDLKIYYDSLKKYYYMEFEGNRYIKNSKISSILPVNTFKDGNHSVYIENYKKLIEEVMIKEKFDIDASIIGLSGVRLSFKEEDGYYYLSIVALEALNENTEIPTYSYFSDSMEEMPEFYVMNSKLVIVEKRLLNDKETRNLFIFSKKHGIEYDLSKVFPIKVNNVELTPDTHYIYAGYDRVNNGYTMLVSNNSNFCVEDSKEKNVAFYEFSLDIDYSNYLFKTPSFVRTWYEKDGCGRVKELMEG